jgi:hypothetical protein
MMTMASNAWWAYGSEFQIDTTKVGEVIDINGPGMSKDAIDVSYSDGTSGDGWRQFIPGWRDGGEVTISLNWIPADSTQDDSSGLLSIFEGDSLQAFKIKTADDGSSSTVTLSFNGIITNFSPTMPLTEQGQLDCTVKVAGAVTVS